MTGAPALEAQDVSKRFDGAKQSALSGISLQVQPGEFYSFLGPSGCGKTTMLRIFAGFETATSGQVFVAGRLMNGIPPNKRPVNMVFQSYALFPHLSVVENVAFGLRAKGGIAGADLLAQSKEALSIVRLASFADRLPAQLSGGQQQRVALARALVMRPVVLLLDEPLSALDVQIREEMQEELSRLQRQLNITFVMVTHDQSEALALSTCVAVFNQGQIEQIGTPKEIYEAPQTAFVAKFIGRSNVLSGTVLEATANSVLVSLFEGQKVWCALDEDAENSPLKPNVGDKIDLCIKPEALLPFLSTQSDSRETANLPGLPNALNLLACQLESSSYQGSMADLRLSIVGAPTPIVLRASVPSQTLTAMAGQPKLRVQFAATDLRILKGVADRARSSQPGEAAHAVVS
jgi:ABC-type Fe3+/spermidine/putrescine transport system ATPase subunit